MKVVIADTSDLIRVGMRSILTSIQSFSDKNIDVREVEDLQNLTEVLSGKDCDIAIVEAAMVEDNLSTELVSKVNHSDKTQFILLAQKASRLVLHFVKGHPNFSLILKSCGLEEIQGCLRMAGKKEQMICNECMKQLIKLERDAKTNSILTPAECMVLAFLAQGLKVKEIADLQFRSKHTIRTHKRDIFEKLGVNTTVEAIMTAYKLGIINPPER